MNAELTRFYEQQHGHDTHWLNKNEIIQLMETYNDEQLEKPPFNAAVIIILLCIFLGGIFIGMAIQAA